MKAHASEVAAPVSVTTRERPWYRWNQRADAPLLQEVRYLLDAYRAEGVLLVSLVQDDWLVVVQQHPP